MISQPFGVKNGVKSSLIRKNEKFGVKRNRFFIRSLHQRYPRSTGNKVFLSALGALNTPEKRNSLFTIKNGNQTKYCSISDSRFQDIDFLFLFDLHVRNCRIRDHFELFQ